MDFGTALAIGTTLLSFTGGSGGGDSGEGGGGMDIGGSSSSSAGSMLGFIKQGAKAYNTMRGENTKPFSQTSQRQETGSYYKRFADSGSTQNTTPASQAYAGYRNPDLSTAIANLVNNAQNTQMQQLMAENSVVQPNRGVGRVVTRTEPSVLSSLGVS
jgi:spore coat protein CotF